MTSEGREYRRRKQEGTDEETDHKVRETINEMKRELENRETPEKRELPEQTYCPDEDVREAIKEIQEEEAERMRLKEQQESEKEEAKETKEKVKEIPQGWDVDRCVRETIQEIEIEQERLREEREKAEMEKEQQREVSRELRKETADSDELDEYEKRIRESFEEHGIDPEEVQERWRKRFEEEVQDELGEESKKKTREQDDESAGSERTAEGSYYYDDGSGQVYEVQMDSKESSSSETEMESSGEVQEKVEEPQPEIQEDTEVKKESEDTESKKTSGEVEPEKVTPTQETEDVVEEKSKKEVRSEQDEIPRVKSEEIKQEKKESTKESVETSSEGHREDTQETRSTPEKSEEKSSSTPEINTKHKQERTESEDSQDTEENVEEKSESREKEIWTEYEVKYGSIEDENHKRALREIKELLPEEEQEKFNESVREKVQTVEDFEELARKHGLDEILENEEVMEEIRNYLKVRRTLEQEPDTDIEKLAEEMEIDAELAEEWSRGESEPYSLKKLLNLEAYHMWDEIIRNYREQGILESKEELEEILKSDSELRKDRFFELERDEAIAYVIIMAMRRRGEIERKIRNGREIYSRKQIMELSKTYGISAREIIAWLRGERVASLIRKIGKNSLKKSMLNSGGEIIENSGEAKGIPWKIDTLKRFQIALKYHNELRFWETFDTQYEKVRDYINGKTNRKPKLLKKLESLELRRSYELIVGSAPIVKIESMHDVRRLESIHKPLTPKERKICEKYFEVYNNWELTEVQLSARYGISKAMVYRWRNHIEPPPIAKLRQSEETRIIGDWLDQGDFEQESHITNHSPILKENQDDNLIPQSAMDGDLNLIDLYKDAYFYFTDKNKLAKLLMNIKQRLGFNDSEGLHTTIQSLNKVLSQTFPNNRSKTFISLRYNRIKGEYLGHLLNLSNWSITNLEKSISKITDISGPGGFTNPKFPKGIELEIVLARIIAIVISDSNLRPNGQITYHEPDLRRIGIVEKYLQALGDIKLNPIYNDNTNHYVTIIPAVIGKALLRLGLTPGNKTIQNSGLFLSFLNFPFEALCAFMEELIPQDGSVTPSSITWGHSHTLHPGFKELETKFKPLISQEEVDFVIKYGKPYEHYRRLAIGKLDKFTRHKDPSISTVATKLMNHIFGNPNNFIEYEVAIVKILGIKVSKDPLSVFYHKRTGAVTIAWGVRTTKKTEALRLAAIAPPNDVLKRRVMRKSILKNPEKVKKIVSEYTKKGIHVRIWWNEE